MSRVRAPRHVAWLVVDYFALRRLIVDYFTYVARLVASARCVACRVTHCRLLLLAQARHRLLRLRRASGCLGTSRGSSSTTSTTPRVRLLRHVARLVAPLVVDYFASRKLVVDYFTSAVRLGASARRATRRAARRRLLRLRRASGCFGMSRSTSRGSSLRSSSTTLPTPHVRVPRHVARLVSPLAVDYFAYAARPGASARRATRHTARRRLLHAPRLRLVATLALLEPRRASRLLVSRQHWHYINYDVLHCDVVVWSHRVDHSSRLLFQNSRERQSRPQQLVRINSD
jgi:hypothetical protein